MTSAEFWMTMAGACFGLWALMIPIGVSMMRKTFDEMTTMVRMLTEEFKQYVLVMERRVTIVEERLRSLERSQKLNGVD